jgi:hypothetical protein
MLERWKGSDQAWDHILKQYKWSPGMLEWLKGYYKLSVKHIGYQMARIKV